MTRLAVLVPAVTIVAVLVPGPLWVRVVAALVLGLACAVIVVGHPAARRRRAAADAALAEAAAPDAVAEQRARDRQQLVAALPDPALVVDDSGHVVAANAHATARFGAVGTASSVGAVVGNARLVRAVDEARATGHTVEVDAQLGDRDVTAIASPLASEVLLLVVDHSELRLTAAVRRDFVANASHELKTPVAGIQALADALAVTVDRDPARARALVTRLSSEAERMTRLVHELLDLRRLEDGVPLQIRPVDVAEVVQREVARVLPGAKEVGVDLAVDIDGPAIVAGVEEDVRLIVANLLENAVGYNRDGGSVNVRLRRSNGDVHLEVEDSGIGIARADLDRVFERFYRVDVARSRAQGRTGLGLAIVRHAAERHGGRVSVRSTLGEGSTFTVRLPVSPEG